VGGSGGAALEQLQLLQVHHVVDYEPESWADEDDDADVRARALEPAPVSRRGFFGRLIGAVLSARLAPRLLPSSFDINRTTNRWWRNRHEAGPLNYDALLSATKANYRGSIEDMMRSENLMFRYVKQRRTIEIVPRDDGFDGLGLS
jgi:hypothetical protein